MKPKEVSKRLEEMGYKLSAYGVKHHCRNGVAGVLIENGDGSQQWEIKEDEIPAIIERIGKRRPPKDG